MKNNFKVTIPLTILITLIAIIYQRTTGPTYPKRFKLEFNNESFTVKLPRSFGGDGDAPVLIPKNEFIKSGTITYKRFPTNDDWTKKEMSIKENNLEFMLPHQPPAGKFQYFIELDTLNGRVNLGSELEPITIRFKGDVPILILAPHIFCMFVSMLFSSFAGLEALFKTQSVLRLSIVTTITLIIGGMILGPIVQKYAFGVYWAGIPFGYDLTDNKLLISVVFWIIGLAIYYFKRKNWAPIMAAVVLILMYSIPHSTMGSQYNYHQNKVETAK